MRFIIVLALVFSWRLMADGCADADYELTVDNPANGETLSAPLALSHQNGFRLLTLGAPASEGLASFIATGDATKLSVELRANTYVLDVQSGAKPIRPGESGTVVVHVSCPATFLALVAKTGEGATFAALDLAAPLKGEAKITSGRFESTPSGIVARESDAKPIRVRVHPIWP